MKVEIKIDPNIEEPAIVIHAPKITPEVLMWAEMFEGAGDRASLLIAKKNDKLFVIEPEQIEIIRTEGGDIKLYNREAQEYMLTKPLHELQEQLGSGFARISKSAIVNINRVDHLSHSFNGTMYIVMKNGVNDYISRKYLSDFKKRLGL
ncbi:MAG: LytTR family transcriptional regulator [Defluviitaleaceae bacterium]|nr:LytTR family transcriptional regulator [Defluviitaleaceae bacterium]